MGSNRNPWTPYEDGILRSDYVRGIKACLPLLPRRTPDAVKNRAKALKLTNKRPANRQRSETRLRSAAAAKPFQAIRPSHARGLPGSHEWALACDAAFVRAMRLHYPGKRWHDDARAAARKVWR